MNLSSQPAAGLPLADSGPGHAPADASPPAAEGAATVARRLEYTEGDSRKFWQVTCRGSEVATASGRIGTKGQTHPKQLPGTESAAKEARRLAAEKLRKGYQEVTEPLR